MMLHAPQIIYLALVSVSVGKALARYGEPKKPDRYDMADVLYGPALCVSILWWGGFFG